MDNGEKFTFRSIVFTVLLPVFVPLLTVLAGIWAAAVWTTGQENKMVRMEDRVLAVEKKNEGSTAHENRISQLEFRLNWMDEEKNRDRNENKQLNKEIRDTLERLNSAVIRLEANDPSSRRR